MTVPKSVLIAFAFLLMAGTGTAMYVGVQLGLANAETGESVAQPARAVTPVDAPSTVERVQVHEEQCSDVLAAEVTAQPEETGSTRRSGRSGRSTSGEAGNFSTNSGMITGSQFTDGGFGDIGQQWWNVNADGDIITLHVAEGGTANVDSGSQATTAVPDSPAATNEVPEAIDGPAGPPAETPLTSSQVPADSDGPATPVSQSVVSDTRGAEASQAQTAPVESAGGEALVEQSGG